MIIEIHKDGKNPKDEEKVSIVRKRMKIVLVAINAKFIHSNLAVHYLKGYAKPYKDKIQIVEYTINHQIEEVLKGIYKTNPDVVAFSSYIWNMPMVKQLGEELKQILPKVQIWLGGPEVSYTPEETLEKNPYFDGIIIGEGEETFLELCQHYVDETIALDEIHGITYRTEGKILVTGQRAAISMDTIPFPYEDMEVFRNKIIYYESSRGCPYSCSYCLSSIERGVRFRDLELVKKELKAFLDHGVAQVKFVDRTFNCNRKRTMELLKFMKENDNFTTNFHFEITADILSDEEIEMLATLRPGQIQLEIGVQTTNPITMKAIRRDVNFEKLSKNVLRIKAGKNIHQHLDLIAGLPYEGVESFKKSFNDVYELKPDQLQLGFLKVLNGSSMKKESEYYNIVYRNNPPYEVLSTDHLSYDEVLMLKGVCDMVELYYNSDQFTYSIAYLEHKYPTPFDLYNRLSCYYEDTGLNQMAHSRVKRYEILLDFYKEEMLQLSSEEEQLFSELLLFDMCLREGVKARPLFASETGDSMILRQLKVAQGKGKGKTHIEHFNYDVIQSSLTGDRVKKEQYILFEYGQKDPITNCAIFKELEV